MSHRLVYGQSDLVRRFVEQVIPRTRLRGLPGNSAAIGVADGNNELIGGFVYHDYDPQAGVIEVSMASIDKRWWSRAILYGLLSYPFYQLECQMVGSRISASDLPLRRMLKAYGFSEYIIPRLFGREADGAICTLTIEAWQGNGFHKEHR